ncbi:MAG TPA: ribosomal protein S18-alanine N-acetyltransferase [bacterium]|nr:ribosomal protein S18-alanine N-acetyltransferase [bacterium]HQL61428.1 ribosomal protein S18-alanine N-acetyltransferase [bacterium]
MSSVQIRPAQLEDLDRIMEIETFSFSCPWSRKTIEEAILRGPIRFLVATSLPEDQVVGYISFHIAAKEVHIMTLATHSTFRRQGIARALLEACIQEGKQAEAAVFHLEVRESNTAALALYRELHFKIVGRRPKYYFRPVEDALLLSRRFDQEDLDTTS